MSAQARADIQRKHLVDNTKTGVYKDLAAALTTSRDDKRDNDYT